MWNIVSWLHSTKKRNIILSKIVFSRRQTTRKHDTQTPFVWSVRGSTNVKSARSAKTPLATAVRESACSDAGECGLERRQVGSYPE